MRRGRSAGISASSDPLVIHKTSIADKPPASETKMLSVRSWRMMRPREAPKACRIASSRILADERATRRLAMLTATIKRTNPTAANSTTNVGRTLPVRFCSTGSIRKDHFEASGYSFGKVRESCAVKAFKRWRACSTVKPGFSRAMAPGSRRCERWGAGKGSAVYPAAAHNSTSPDNVGPGWRKSGGMTPTMV